ncbi:antirepressor AbbA [Metabacillus iocasae]|uniref:Antirepressor AbbA n=1 Tax=Priestia iocasae TaxID=2291674 RepID=A0ABS2QVU8_9BACI|nr:antirepressor AbbA [Metabacillus iocasae]MBM7703403.1 hypothetical protein [Metabacillus iocasae]
MSLNSTTLLSSEEARLLLDLLFKQHYAVEVVSSHISDIENGLVSVEEEEYKRISSLYHRLQEM